LFAIVYTSTMLGTYEEALQNIKVTASCHHTVAILTAPIMPPSFFSPRLTFVLDSRTAQPSLIEPFAPGYCREGSSPHKQKIKTHGLFIIQAKDTGSLAGQSVDTETKLLFLVTPSSNEHRSSRAPKAHSSTYSRRFARTSATSTSQWTVAVTSYGVNSAVGR